MARSPAQRSIDWRIVAGLLMVLAGGIGTVALVGWMDTTKQYLTVVTDVAEGQTLTSSDLTVVDVHVRQGSVPYLMASDRGLVEGARVTTSLQAGELIPLNALGSPRSLDTTTVTMSLNAGGAPWLTPGARVDVWLSPAIEQGLYGPPRVVATSAVVSGVRSEEGFAADPTVVNVDIRVVRRDAPAIIGALANNFPLHLTPSYQGEPQ
jgi:Flp pilus assembly protein CpaB